MGEYDARVCMPRILELQHRTSGPATFFFPNVAAVLYPDEARQLVSDGHEIGVHDRIHEFNSALPGPAEHELAMRSAETLERLAGVRPVGMRTPFWDLSPYTLAMQQKGY